MAIENDEIFKQLSHLADAFLLHDRPIYQRADDSVLRVHENKIKIIRRSRGYVPEYIPLPFNVGLSGAIAVGPELSSTGAILRRNRIFPTQHIGNVTRFETFEFLKNSIFHIKNLLKIKDNEIRFIACDKHPLFLSTSLAKELSEKYFVKFQTKIAELNPPEIYGGTGDIGIFPPYSPDDLDKVLIKTMGFRLFGQKFIPDSYIFTNLVYPKVDKYLGNKKPFTMVSTQAGPTRGFPRGLDVFAVLGSNLALQILQKEDDTNYENFEKQFNLLKDEFSSFTEKDWHKNLYWNWLYSLKKLNEPKNTGYPKFMTSTAWQTRVLNTTLSSWTELRHDTILYAKQSYTALESAMGPSPPSPPEKPV